MASERDAGYATPAAALISLAVAAVVAATTSRAMVELKLAKADRARISASYALDAAQNAAVIAISTSIRAPPYRWKVASLGESFVVVAEPERAKLSPAAAATLPASVLVGLGALDVEQVRARLRSSHPGPRLTWISDEADAPTWRGCASTFISPYGVAAGLPAPLYSQPEPAQTPSLWRAGEVWRIQVTSPTGWRDERIVRFTGNGLTPASVIGRRLTRTWKGQPQCEALFETSAAS